MRVWIVLTRVTREILGAFVDEGLAHDHGLELEVDYVVTSCELDERVEPDR